VEEADRGQRVLAGKKIVITRSRSQAQEFAAKLANLGAAVIAFPTIKVMPMPSHQQLDEALRHLTDYDYLIFTSANAVKFFLERWETRPRDLVVPAGLKVAAVGPATAKALEKAGWKIELIPAEHRAEALVESLLKAGVSGKKVLLPRALVAREVLPDELRAAGAEVDVIPVYQTVLEESGAGDMAELLRSKEVDVITFTSASTVKNFYRLLKDKVDLIELLPKVKIACIGPVTAEEAGSLGIKVDIVAEEYTIDGLVAAIVKVFEK
jgi:uroporphyrinogen III methyltransferase/synthase